MHRLRESLIWKYVAIYVAASMALPYAVVGFPASARAQAQPVVTSATCIVLPVLDPAGSDRSVESQKATDALAIALEDSREFTVTSKLDLERELTSLGLTTPLSEEEQVRLADRLAVEKVVSGQVVVLGVDGQTGECIARLQVQMLDAAMAEYLNGAQVLVKTKPMPGWTGEERNRVINKALREAAETAVWQMRATRVRVGAVTSVSDLGVAMIGLGAEDGVSTGLEMLVVRPTYQKDLDEIMMMKVGKLGVKDVQSDMSYARPLAGSRAKIGDKVYALYKPPVRMVAEARSRGLKKTGRLVTALGLFAGLLAVAGGDHSSITTRSGIYRMALLTSSTIIWR